MAEAYCVILTTAGSREEAGKLSEMLVTRKLAACVQFMEMTSTYFWDGKLNRGPEFLLFVKTASHLYPAVEAALVENHSYQVPEVVELQIARGLPGYLDWLGANIVPVKGP